MWAYANALTGHAPDAEDLLHQAFLQAFDVLRKDRHAIRDIEKWLRGTLRILVRAWWRERRRLPQELAEQLYEVAERADSAPNRLLKAELAEMLRQCLQRLAPHARRLVAARYEQGLQVEQIATQEKINATAARVRLFRIRQTLRDCLDALVPRGASQ